MKVSGSILQQQVDTVPRIIGARLRDNATAELSNLEQSALTLDANMCASFMKKDFEKGRYREMLGCAERLIQDSVILKAYGESTNSELIEYQLKMADQLKQIALICWENPESAGQIISMERAHNDGNLERYEQIRKEVMKDNPIIR